MSILDSKKAKKKFPNIRIGENSRIHTSSVIIGRVRIGKNVHIGENVHIFKGVTIDNDVKIDDQVVIFRGVSVLTGAHIQSGAHIKSFAIINEGVVVGKDAIICPHSFFRDNAVIEKGGEGIVLHVSYETTGVYFDSRTGEVIVRLGCHHRTIEEWENDFDNNVNEFPIGSPQREARWQTFQFLKQWRPCFYN